MALILIIITPLIWSLPVALMVSELATAIPEDGGYYAWVKQGLNSYWGFQVGWWSWLMSFVDMAIYPVLFANYLSSLLIQYFQLHWLAESELAHWLISLGVIWTCTVLNIRGTKIVGDVSRLFGILVLLPFSVFSVIGIYHWCLSPLPVWQPLVPPAQGISGAFGVGLFVVMWNYMGWDIIANVAGEIDKPQRTLPSAMTITIPLITLAYLLPVFAGLTSTIDWQHWTAGYFPQIAAAVAGDWLGIWLGIAALVSAVALFNALLLSFSRIPFVMALDGYLPITLTRLHPKYQTPYVAILVCSIIYSLFTLSAFASLIVVDVMLYAAVLLLEYGALIALRYKRPELVRPYRIPWGWCGIAIVTFAPITLLGLAIITTIKEEGWQALFWSLAAIATGPVIYPFLRKKCKKRPRVG